MEFAPPGARETAKAAAMAEEEGKPLTAKELAEMLGACEEGLKDSVDRIDVDLAKWRLRTGRRGRRSRKEEDGRLEPVQVNEHAH